MATIGISTSCFYPAETEKALRTAAAAMLTMLIDLMEKKYGDL